MLSRTSEYALKAMVYLTQHIDEWPIPGRRIAEDLDVPGKYLSNVLRDLVRSGVLVASPGKHGGFRLAREPRSIRLREVVAPFESMLVRRQGCPFNAECSDDDPCAAHDRWQRIKQEYLRFLDETSVHDVALRKINQRKDGRRKSSQRRRKK